MHTDLFHILLKEKFKLPAFRPGQLEAMQSLFENYRLLCIQPTGYGKSLLYQLPSCLLPGITIVISPLLALMRDQIDQLIHRFEITAASINSDQTEEENAETRRRLLAGEIKILFTSPEQLDHIDRFEFLLKLPITLMVIDEAHCISTWGHDFRPSYRRILHFCQALQQERPQLKILGLTATADERVEKDIAAQLSSAAQPVHVWREKMDRPNIHLSVLPVEGIAAKLGLCKVLLSKLSGHGLIYCSTRENTELVAEYLQKEGFSVIAYHAGLESDDKRKIQKGFTDNAYRAIVATTALGMGIDKKDLRYVIHFDFPGSITAYYQEVGRSGRDGLKADGIMLYDKADRKVQDYFIDASLPTEKDFQLILTAVRASAEPPNLTTIKRFTGLHPTRVTIVVAELLEQNFLKKESQRGTQVYKIHYADQCPDLTRYNDQHLVKREELEKIISYAEQKTSCRMTLLRSALGDPSTVECGRCDLCEKQLPMATFDTSAEVLWISHRSVPIAAAKMQRLSPGASLLDGKLRTPPFLRFMKGRAITEEVDAEILSLLITKASIFIPVDGVVAIPSRTWKAQVSFAEALAQHLNVPLFSDLLAWNKLPDIRQGELFNNDQRHHNVHGKMIINQKTKLPTRGLILFDDYIGSGATMKEAARCLRKIFDGHLMPLTIASVKWRLGKQGFV